MGKVTFSLEDDYHGRSINMTLEDGSTWSELSEEFFLFLQACGYIVTRSDLAEQWAEYLEVNSEAADNPPSGNVTINIKDMHTMATEGLFTPSGNGTITVTPSTASFSNNPLNWSYNTL